MLRYIFLGLLCAYQASYAATAAVSDITPFDLGELVPFSPHDVRMNQEVCVYSSTGFYTVTIFGNEPGNKFRVMMKNKKPIDYQLRWNNHSGTTENIELEAGKPSVRFQMTPNTCLIPPDITGSVANLEMVIPAQQLKGARAGSYQPSFRLEILAVL